MSRGLDPGGADMPSDDNRGAGAVNSRHAEPASAAADESGTTTAGPAPVINVACNSYLIHTPLLICTLFGATIAAVAVAIVTASLAPTPVAGLMCFSVLIGAALLVLAVMLRVQRANLGKIRNLMADVAAHPSAASMEVALPRIRGLWPQTTTREAVKALGESGRGDITIRIAPRAALTPIAPISVPFEPRRLDELSDLETAGATTDDTPSARKPPPRGIRRNVILKGGWWLVIFFGVTWAVYAVGAIQSRAITPNFMLWTVALLAFVLAPVRSAGFGFGQWLAVPGGLIVRKGGWFRRRWDVRLFKRRESTLMLYNLYRRQWALVVADGERCESTIGTYAELECVLRAWLSPIDTPELKQLSDWL